MSKEGRREDNGGNNGKNNNGNGDKGHGTITADSVAAMQASGRELKKHVTGPGLTPTEQEAMLNLNSSSASSSTASSEASSKTSSTLRGTSTKESLISPTSSSASAFAPASKAVVNPSSATSTSTASSSLSSSGSSKFSTNYLAASAIISITSPLSESPISPFSSSSNSTSIAAPIGASHSASSTAAAVSPSSPRLLESPDLTLFPSASAMSSSSSASSSSAGVIASTPSGNGSKDSTQALASPRPGLENLLTSSNPNNAATLSTPDKTDVLIALHSRAVASSTSKKPGAPLAPESDMEGLLGEPGEGPGKPKVADIAKTASSHPAKGTNSALPASNATAHTSSSGAKRQTQPSGLPKSSLTSSASALAESSGHGAKPPASLLRSVTDSTINPNPINNGSSSSSSAASSRTAAASEAHSSPKLNNRESQEVKAETQPKLSRPIFLQHPPEVSALKLLHTLLGDKRQADPEDINELISFLIDHSNKMGAIYQLNNLNFQFSLPDLSSIKVENLSGLAEHFKKIGSDLERLATERQKLKEASDSADPSTPPAPMKVGTQNQKIQLSMPKDVSFNSRDEFGYSLVSKALRNNHLHALHLLLANGASILDVAQNGETALHVVTNGKVLDGILGDRNNGLRELVNTKDDRGFTPLMSHIVANRRDCVEVLLDKKHDLKHDFNLIIGKKEAVSSSASANLAAPVSTSTPAQQAGAQVQPDAKTVLFLAAEMDAVIYVKLLLAANAKLFIDTPQGKLTIFHHAPIGNEVFPLLFKHKEAKALYEATWYGLTPLLCRVKNNDYATATKMLEYGVHLDALTPEKYNVLHLATNVEFLRKFLSQGGVKEYLLEDNGSKKTPLMYQIERVINDEGNIDCVRELLAQGAKIHDFRHEILDAAIAKYVSAAEGSQTIYKQLIELILPHYQPETRTEVLNKSAKSPVNAATEKREKEIALTLINAGGDPNSELVQKFGLDAFFESWCTNYKDIIIPEVIKILDKKKIPNHLTEHHATLEGTQPFFQKISLIRSSFKDSDLYGFQLVRNKCLNELYKLIYETPNIVFSNPMQVVEWFRQHKDVNPNNKSSWHNFDQSWIAANPLKKATSEEKAGENYKTSGSTATSSTAAASSISSPAAVNKSNSGVSGSASASSNNNKAGSPSISSSYSLTALGANTAAGKQKQLIESAVADGNNNKDNSSGSGKTSSMNPTSDN